MYLGMLKNYGGAYLKYLCIFYNLYSIRESRINKYTFLQISKNFKRFYRLCFWNAGPLIKSFYLNDLIKHTAFHNKSFIYVQSCQKTLKNYIQSTESELYKKFFAGRYQHNTHVVNNSISGNCYGPEWISSPYGLESRSTFAAILKNETNYETFYAGKYLNKYNGKAIPKAD